MRKKEKDLGFLIPVVIFAVFFVGATILLSYALTPIQETIIERLHTPVNVDVLSSATNHDLTCHKVGLYTDWDEGFGGGLSGFLTGIYAGEHARQMFFENDCSLVCYKYWESEKMCLGELYPHE